MSSADRERQAREARTAELVRQARDSAKRSDGRFGPKPPRRHTAECELGRMMRASRMRLRLTMADVGEATGVGEGTVCAWEGGRAQPNAARLWRLVCVLELDCVLLVRALDPNQPGPQGPSSTAQEGPDS